MKRELRGGTVLQAGPPSVVVMATCVSREVPPNIITLGMYMPISFNPPQVCIGVSLIRHSHGLIKETGEFVINVPSIGIERETHFCGVNLGRDVDKFRETELTPTPSKKLRPPRIRECFGHIEYRVVGSYICGDHTLCSGDVLSASADEKVINVGTLDILRARTHPKHREPTGKL